LRPPRALIKWIIGDWYVDFIATFAASRGQGMGRESLRASLEKGCAAGADRAGLIVVSANAPTIALYLSEGFAEVERGLVEPSLDVRVR